MVNSNQIEKIESFVGVIEGIYNAIYKISLVDHSTTEIYAKSYVHDAFSDAKNAENMRDIIAEELVLPKWRDVMYDFNEIRTVATRLKTEQQLSVEFESVHFGWQREYIIPHKFDPVTGKIIEVLITTENIDEIKKEEIKRQAELERQVNITKSFGAVYIASFHIDLKTDTFSVLHAYDDIIKITGTHGTASTTLMMTTYKTTDPEYIDSMLEFGELSSIAERLENTNLISKEFLGLNFGWCRANFIASKRDENGTVIEAIYAIQIIDDEKRLELENQRIIERQLAITKSLSDIYYSAHYFNIDANEFVELSASTIIRDAIGIKGLATDALSVVAHMFTTPAYIREMEDFLNIHTLKARLMGVDDIYHEFIGAVHGWTRAGFICAKRDENGVATHAIFITQIIDNEKQKELQLITDLRDAVDTANRATQAKTEFLSHMSHEIRTPINAILGFNEIIRRESNEKKILEYAANIADSGAALMSIIDDVLDFSKIESGRMEIITENYDLRSLINDCYHLVIDRVNKKGLTLNVVCDETLPSKYKGDMPHLRQIIVNLLTNAVKYTDKGSITLNIGRKIVDNGFALNVSIKDTGTGIKSEDIDKLFGRFQRLDLERNQGIEGSGLGLAITKNLVEAMGGIINVESTYKVGSTFTVLVPQYIVDETSIGHITFGHKDEVIEEKKNEKRFEAPGKTVLVVDDVAMNIKVFSLLLDRSKITVDKALSGAEALAITKDKKYDLIFMDHMMPEMNGIDAMVAIKEQENGANTETPIIMLTANALGGMREQYLALGFADYLSKPIRPDRLEEMLKRFLS